MNRIFNWFLPRFTTDIEKPLQKPVQRLGLTEASNYAKATKGVVYKPSQPSGGTPNGKKS
jgi:hypothetical protein